MTVCSNMRCENSDCEYHYGNIVKPGRYEFVDLRKNCSKPKKNHGQAHDPGRNKGVE